MDPSRSLETIHYYAETDSIKGVLVRVDSPGGAVGASQEIYEALRDLKTKYQKPVVISMGNVAASGFKVHASDPAGSNLGVNIWKSNRRRVCGTRRKSRWPIAVGISIASP